MQAKIVGLVLALAIGAGGYVLGRTGATASAISPAALPGSLEEQVEQLQAENRRLTETVEARGPQLTGAPAGSARPGPRPIVAAVAATLAERDALLEPLEAIDFAAIQTPEELIEHVLRYVHTLLGKGREGHLELLSFLGHLAGEGGKELEGHFRRIFQDDSPRIVKHLYPLIKYAVEHDEDVTALTETFFAQAAGQPAWFEGMDDDPFEMFTEVFGLVAPAVATEAQMDRLRAHAVAILETPEDRQPEALRKSRRDIQKLVMAWSPPLSAEEALARLQGGDLPVEQLMELLPLIPKDTWEHVDVAALVMPLLVAQDWNAMQILRRVPPLDARAVGRLDDALLAGYAGEVQAQWWFLQQWLETTGRGATWEASRPLLERAVRVNARTANAVGQALLQRGGEGQAPDAAWVRWMLDTAQVADGMADQLRTRFGLDR